MRLPILATMLLAACAVDSPGPAPAPDPAEDQNARFDALATRFIDAYLPLSPIRATQLGDHRFDRELDQVTRETIGREIELCRRFLAELHSLPSAALSRERQVDYALLYNRLAYDLWQLEELEEWAWNPLRYTGLAGGAIYNLVARDFAPWPQRLAAVIARLEGIGRLLEQTRAILDPARVPAVHAETAIKQNPGFNSMLDEMVVPHLGTLAPTERERLERAIAGARQAVQEHQRWLESELLPNAQGDFRVGAETFDRKLAFVSQSALSRQEIRRRAEAELRQVRAEMYGVARHVLDGDWPLEPTAEQEQQAIAAALELAYKKTPAPSEIVAVATQYLADATEFVRERDLVSLPGDPVEVVTMPEFRRGVTVAYCDSPGPLDVGLKTFYAVAPLPAEWTEEQVRSYLREYNLLSMQDLTIHEAMPGHYLQIAHAQRHPSKLRAILSSGPFVEGWAVYAERLMIDEGYLDHDPLMRLVNRKWYLRVITNALIDQAIHVDGMTRDAAMQLMVEGGFQQEREAAGKWTRAQLTFGQLSTYFVGYQEHRDMRQAAEQAWGEQFTLKRYHDAALSFGAPPVAYARALLLSTPIPGRPHQDEAGRP